MPAQASIHLLFLEGVDSLFRIGKLRGNVNHNFGGSGKCIVEFIYDDGNLPSCVAFSGSWGYYNWNGLDLGANIKSIKKINYGEPVDY